MTPKDAPPPAPAPTIEADHEVIEATLMEKFWRLAQQENDLPTGKSSPKLTAELDRVQNALLKIRANKKKE